MKKRRISTIFFLTLGLALVFVIVPVGVVVAEQISGETPLSARWTVPPVHTVDNGLQQMALNSYDETDEMIFGDYHRDFCLGYLDTLKDEALTGGESATEADRITRKNELLQQYRKYVDGLYNQMMTSEEYDAHYDHLMEVYIELISLEPEPTPKEQIERNIRRLLSPMDEALYYSELHGEMYIKGRGIDVPLLKSATEELRVLLQDLCSEQVTFEQAQSEYAACIEMVKTAIPGLYEGLVEYEQVVELGSADGDGRGTVNK